MVIRTFCLASDCVAFITLKYAVIFQVQRTHDSLDMDSSDSIGVYGEAKAEYTRQLCIFLVPALETYFLDLLAETKEAEKNPQRVLWVFQDSLKQFPEWNMDKVAKQTEKVITATKCDYLEEILTAVFIAHTKVLSAIRLTSKQKKLQITIPKLDHFLHRTMSECARLLWANAYLFSETGSSIDKQKNLRQVEQLLHEGVLQSIRGMLPVKSILKEYLADDGDEDAPVVANTAEEKEKEKEEESIQPVIPESFIQDLSGGSIEIKAEPIPEAVPEPVVEAPIPIHAPTPTTTPTPTAPTIVVDTEPAKVSFTSMDTFFDSHNPSENSIHEPVIKPEEEDEDMGVTSLEISNDPPEPIDDYENLEETETLAMDEFETL